MSFILRFSLSGPASLFTFFTEPGHYGFSGCWFSFIIGAEFFVASPESTLRELSAISLLMPVISTVVPDNAGG